MIDDTYVDDRGWTRHLFWVGLLLLIGGIGWFARGIFVARSNPDATLHNPEVARRAADQGYTYLHFDRLRGVSPDSDAGNIVSTFKGIPDEIRQYDGRKVCLEGYASPFGLENGKLTRFLLFRHLASCCFGAPAQMNEWVEVRTVSPEARDVIVKSGDGIAVFGKLLVGERTASDGVTKLFYSLECERIEMILPF